MPQTDGDDVVGELERTFEPQNRHIGIVQVVLVVVIFVRDDRVHVRKLGAFVEKVVHVVHAGHGQDPLGPHEAVHVVHTVGRCNEVPLGDDRAAADVLWAVDLDAIEEWDEPRELSLVDELAVDREAFEDAVQGFAAGSEGKSWVVEVWVLRGQINDLELTSSLRTPVESRLYARGLA